MNFAALGLIEPLLQTLGKLGYATPTPVQRQAIPPVLAGCDLMATAQTGTGKTAGFALPLLQILATRKVGGRKPELQSNSARALVLVPTRELAEQVHTGFRNYGAQLALRTAVVYGGVSINPQMMALRKGVDVLVATPGRLLDLQRRNAVKFDSLQLLVLDEADRMLDLGFSRELGQLLALLPQRRQTLLFSATFSDAVRTLAGELLKQPVSIDASARNTTAKTVDQWLIPVDKRFKIELFCHLLRRHSWSRVLVFAKTRKTVEQLLAELARRQVEADAIHGDKPQPARLRALQRFKNGGVQVLIATDVAARGLDIEDLPVVLNLDLPIVAADYVHRIGRTGRAGASGQAVSLVCADEVALLRAIESLIGQTLPRREEPGFEPDHRVPPTGNDAPRKIKRNNRKKPSSARSEPAPRSPAPARSTVAPLRKRPRLDRG